MTKLVVPVKQAVSLDEDFELLDSGRVDPDFLQWELNEWDSFSVELALELREGLDGDGHEVVAVTVGDEESEEALRGCLAKGADRAVRVWDESLADADPLAVARVLAAVVGRESPDLVLCGVQASDSGNGATGVALAGYLDLPHVAVVRRVQYDAASSTLTVERELEGGLAEVVRVGAPALLTIQTGINEPRYATLRAIKQAAEKPLEVTGLDQLGLEREAVAAAAGSRRTALLTPERDERAEMLDGPPVAVAARIMELVQERMKG